MKFTVYEIPGIKVGCTSRYPYRVKQQGYNPECARIVYESNDIYEVSVMERAAQREYGYDIDKVPYYISYLKTQDPKVGDKISASKKGKTMGTNNQFYGKHHTEENKRKHSAFMKGTIPPNAITITILGRDFQSIEEASRDSGIPCKKDTIRKRLKSTKFPDYQYK